MRIESQLTISLADLHGLVKRAAHLTGIGIRCLKLGLVMCHYICGAQCYAAAYMQELCEKVPFHMLSYCPV